MHCTVTVYHCFIMHTLKWKGGNSTAPLWQWNVVTLVTNLNIYAKLQIIATYTSSTTRATYHVSTYRIILHHKCTSTVSTIIRVQKECMHVKSQIILVSVHLFHQIRVFLQNDLSLHLKSWGQLSTMDAEIHWENAEFLQLEDKKGQTSNLACY